MIARCRRDPEKSRGMHCWKDRAWPRLGVRAVALFGYLSLALFFFRGGVGRNLRLADRSGAPHALLDEERRGVI